MLAKIIPDWINGNVNEVEQNHNEATFCSKIQKSDGKVDLNDNPEKNLKKIRAYNIWPNAFYFETTGDKKTRIIVKKAHIENGELVLDRITPEGKKEMDYKDYLRGQRN